MYSRYTVHSVTIESEKVRTFFLKPDTAPIREPSPGQFIMLLVPGMEEIPLSIADYLEGDIVLAIAVAGETTRYLHERVRPGHKLFVRGPLGKGFTICEEYTYVLVGGGYGAAPLRYLARKLYERGIDCVYVGGAKTSKELLYTEFFEAYCSKTYYATEDGSLGYKGLVTELLAKVIDGEFRKRENVFIAACGPEKMLRAVVDFAISRGLKGEVSVERYIKCGIGVCGSCTLDPLPIRVCREGPVIDIGLAANSKLGFEKRVASGRVVKL